MGKSQSKNEKNKVAIERGKQREEQVLPNPAGHANARAYLSQMPQDFTNSMRSIGTMKEAPNPAKVSVEKFPTAYVGRVPPPSGVELFWRHVQEDCIKTLFISASTASEVAHTFHLNQGGSLEFKNFTIGTITAKYDIMAGEFNKELGEYRIDRFRVEIQPTDGNRATVSHIPTINVFVTMFRPSDPGVLWLIVKTHISSLQTFDPSSGAIAILGNNHTDNWVWLVSLIGLNRLYLNTVPIMTDILKSVSKEQNVLFERKEDIVTVFMVWNMWIVADLKMFERVYKHDERKQIAKMIDDFKRNV
ncbi:unnamed protein product [Caenorhabditis sp. 36 PRJEB53466]|nr:unnamed protein product [Caenorhabditis sp. 36 PRJEB53466]